LFAIDQRLTGEQPCRIPLSSSPSSALPVSKAAPWCTHWADLTKSSVSVILPVEGLDTGVEKLDEALKGPDFLDEAKYPTITFKSIGIEKRGEENGLKVTGDLTVHGVIKSVTLDATVNKIGIFEIPGVIKAQAAGFDATAVIKRSDFGVIKYLPLVSDELPVRITLDAKQAQAK
jgi:polyisoprenoid-binding protein YceI